MGMTLRLPGSPRVYLAPSLWLSVLFAAGCLRLGLAIGEGINTVLMRSPVAEREIARRYIAAMTDRGALRAVQFEPPDPRHFRDLRGFFRLAFSGYPVTARTVYRHWKAEHLRLYTWARAEAQAEADRAFNQWRADVGAWEELRYPAPPDLFWPQALGSASAPAEGPASKAGAAPPSDLP